jgi:hypothetical protein
MPIKWSALKVSEAADMIEEYFNQAVEPLEQIKVVAQEARHIPNLPEYISQYLVRIEGEVERAIGGSQFEPVGRYRANLEALRKAIPDGVLEAEQEQAERGAQMSLV